MKSYKNFPVVYVGESDIASLIVRSCGDDRVAVLDFGGDGAYQAYHCIGDDVEIGEHYVPVFEGHSWLKIYDDHGLAYNENRYCEAEHTKVTLYRAGGYGLIIHWHS